MYGVPVNEPNRRPIDELVLTILSQHTNDRNSGRAFKLLKETLPDLGRSARRAARRGRGRDPAGRPWRSRRRRGSRRSCASWGPEPNLDWTEDAPIEESRAYLLSLPGVGRKTAACVLIFSWGLPEIPVDVHIHRVGGRLGLFPAKASLERAHDEMLAIVPPEDAYELHVNLIRHGRTLCRPKPKCGGCELRRMCPWYRDLDHRELIADG